MKDSDNDNDLINPAEIGAVHVSKIDKGIVGANSSLIGHNSRKKKNSGT